MFTFIILKWLQHPRFRKLPLFLHNFVVPQWILPQYYLPWSKPFLNWNNDQVKLSIQYHTRLISFPMALTEVHIARVPAASCALHFVYHELRPSAFREVLYWDLIISTMITMHSTKLDVSPNVLDNSHAVYLNTFWKEKKLWQGLVSSISRRRRNPVYELLLKRFSFQYCSLLSQFSCVAIK